MASRRSSAGSTACTSSCPKAEIAGRIELDGLDLYGPGISPTEVRAKIGMVFQKPNPFPAMSIADNVLAGLRLTGEPTRGRDDLIEESLRRAGLWEEVKDRLDDGGMSLSGGQQQRLCIARALAVSPEVLLMDEPCSALDPISTRVIEETIRELRQDVTIVIVTHNMQQAQRVSDDCAFFMIEEMGSPGRIVEAGPTRSSSGRPATRARRTTCRGGSDECSSPRRRRRSRVALVAATVPYRGD